MLRKLWERVRSLFRRDQMQTPTPVHTTNSSPNVTPGKGSKESLDILDYFRLADEYGRLDSLPRVDTPDFRRLIDPETVAFCTSAEDLVGRMLRVQAIERAIQGVLALTKCYFDRGADGEEHPYDMEIVELQSYCVHLTAIKADLVRQIEDEYSSQHPEFWEKTKEGFYEELRLHADAPTVANCALCLKETTLFSLPARRRQLELACSLLPRYCDAVGGVQIRAAYALKIRELIEVISDPEWREEVRSLQDSIEGPLQKMLEECQQEPERDK